MKHLLLLALLVGCIDKDRPRKNAKLKANFPNTMECIESSGESPTIFCVDDDHLNICTADECLVYAPH